MIVIAIIIAMQPMLEQMPRHAPYISAEDIQQLKDVAVPKDRVLPVIATVPAGSGAKTCAISADN